jgi:hypothetical protein
MRTAEPTIEYWGSTYTAEQLLERVKCVTSFLTIKEVAIERRVRLYVDNGRRVAVRDLLALAQAHGDASDRQAMDGMLHLALERIDEHAEHLHVLRAADHDFIEEMRHRSRAEKAPSDSQLDYIGDLVAKLERHADKAKGAA